MFKRKRNTALIKDTYNDFEERLRWHLFFSFTHTDDNSESYDPDYEVPHERKGKPPVMPPYLELGLQKDRVFVNQTICKIPKEDNLTPFKSIAPRLNQIKEFLLSNNYVVMNTDKNLGIAVSHRTWLSDKCLELLNDEANYRKLHPLTAIGELDNKCIHMEELAGLAQNHLHDGKQIAKFF